MSDPSSPIPAPRPDDDEDVHWALSTSSALWARGDTGEALKWLRRAAETASDQNRDQRSLELFKAAADATSQVEARGPAATPPPAAVVSRPPPAILPSAPPPAAVVSRPPPAHTPSTPPVAASRPPPAPAPSAPPSSAARTQPLPPLGSGRPPMKVAATPSPGPTTPSPGRVSSPPGRSPLPGPVAAARSVLKQTLPSSGIEAGREAAFGPGSATPIGVPGPGKPASSAPSAARREVRRNTLDGRFQFPDDEVTVERDIAALRRPKPIATADGAQGEGVASGTAQTSPHPDVGTGGAPTPPPAEVAPVEPIAPMVARVSPKGPLHATTTRTVLSAGMAPRAPVAAPPEPESPSDNTPIDDHDLDELTSVLAGDEPELDFQGSQTGESIGAHEDDARTPHAHDRGRRPHADDERVLAQAAAEAAAEVAAPVAAAVAEVPAVASSTHTTWPATRVAVRRDAQQGLRLELLANDAKPPPGSLAAILVAQDPATAAALQKLLQG